MVRVTSASGFRPSQLEPGNQDLRYRMSSFPRTAAWLSLVLTLMAATTLGASASFPKPVGLGGRAVGWLEAEVQDWLQRRIEASRNAAR